MILGEEGAPEAVNPIAPSRVSGSGDGAEEEDELESSLRPKEVMHGAVW